MFRHRLLFDSFRSNLLENKILAIQKISI